MCSVLLLRGMCMMNYNRCEPVLSRSGGSVLAVLEVRKAKHNVHTVLYTVFKQQCTVIQCVKPV
jgi:hypothetical protein